MSDTLIKAGHSRYRAARRLLIFWTVFIGVGAVAGAAMMLIDPSGHIMGMDAMLPYFQVLPLADVLFQDLFFSGMALLIVNGLTNLTAAVLLLKNKPLGVTLGGLFGVTLMLWICIQFYMFPPNFMSTIYFIFGLAQAATGYAARVFAGQEAFSVREADYPHVGKNPRELVGYFSRLGYGKKLAYERAEGTGASLPAPLGFLPGGAGPGLLPPGGGAHKEGGLHPGSPHRGCLRKRRPGDGRAAGHPAHGPCKRAEPGGQVPGGQQRRPCRRISGHDKFVTGLSPHALAQERNAR